MPIRGGSENPIPAARVTFPAPLLALVFGISSSNALSPHLPVLTSLMIGCALIASVRSFDRRFLTLTALLACLVLGIVSEARSGDATRREIVKDSAVARRADEVFSWHTARFVRAILLAETDILDESDRIHYRRAGLTHLLAISGLNVAILAGFFWCAARGIAGRSAATEYAAAMATAVYILGIGAPPSALRAGLMAVAVFLARGMKRPAHILNVLLGSAFVTLAFDPSSLRDVGFQLSYAATLGLILWTKPLASLLPARPRLLNKIVAVSAAAQLPTIPIMMSVFGEFAPVAFLANIAVVPIFALLMPVIVLALCGVPGAAFLTELLHARTTTIVSAFAGMLGASYLIDRPPLPATVALLGLSAIPLLSHRRARRTGTITLAGLALIGTFSHHVEDGLYLVWTGSRAGVIRVDSGRAELLDPGLPTGIWRRALSELDVHGIGRIAALSPASLAADRAFSLIHDRPVDAWEINSRWASDAEVSAMTARLERAGVEIKRRKPEQAATIRSGPETIALGPTDDTRVTIRIEKTGRREYSVRSAGGSHKLVMGTEPGDIAF